MPHIKIFGLEKAKVKVLSADLTEKLAQAIGCPQDWIYFSCLGDGDIFASGKPLKDRVFVEIQWFDRGLSVKQNIVNILTDGILQDKGKLSKIQSVNFVFVTTSDGDFYITNKEKSV